MDGQAKANIKGMVAENNGVYTINIRVYMKEKKLQNVNYNIKYQLQFISNEVKTPEIYTILHDQLNYKT